jgi:acetoin utilization deacetylase AcuC-like enzyme
VTPIEVERFENGVRVIFKPLGSSYSSKNDERKSEKKLEAIKEVKKAPDGPKSMAYMSPEKEKEEEERLEKEKNIQAAVEEEKKSVVKKSGLQKLEGGLEMIVESYPYRRIRIKRCLMGAQTIVKEESEPLLLRSVLKGIQVLENDYRIALMTSFKV